MVVINTFDEGEAVDVEAILPVVLAAARSVGELTLGLVDEAIGKAKNADVILTPEAAGVAVAVHAG